MNGFFITGTDTGAGKTALSALLLAELRRRGISAAPMKPAQTGCKPEGLRPEALDLRKLEESSLSLKSKVQSLPSAPDLDYCLSMAGMKSSNKDRALMSPYCFEPACSPHLAAELAGTEIEIGRIVAAAQELASEYETLIIEGSGGVLVPLNRQETMLDLMKALELPVIFAARPGLGTINHTLLSIRALRAAKLEIAGVVFVASEAGGPGFIEEDNAVTIEQFGEVPVLGTIPFCTQLRNPHADYSALPIPVISAVEKIVSELKL
jgi:dethiobiotin synthetase